MIMSLFKSIILIVIGMYIGQIPWKKSHLGEHVWFWSKEKVHTVVGWVKTKDTLSNLMGSNTRIDPAKEIERIKPKDREALVDILKGN